MSRLASCHPDRPGHWNTGLCRSCYRKKQYVPRPKKIRKSRSEYLKEWQNEHRSRINFCAKRRYWSDPITKSNYVRDWQRRNSEKVGSYQLKRLNKYHDLPLFTYFSTLDHRHEQIDSGSLTPIDILIMKEEFLNDT